MTTKDFAGQGDALLTEPMRAYRAWTVKIELKDIRNRQAGRNSGDPFLDWMMNEPHRFWPYTSDPFSSYRSGHRVFSGDDRRRYEAVQARRRGLPGYHEALRRIDTTGKLMIPGTTDELTKMTLMPVSQTGSGAWRRDMTATCLSASPDSHIPWHTVPEADCTCGIYSWYRPQEAAVEHTGIIVGVISVLGRTVLGDRGIRSSKARLEAVTINSDMAHLLPFESKIILAGLRQEAERKGGPYEGIVVCDTEAELRRRFKPDLDTVANLLGRDIVDELVYGGRPIAGFTHRLGSAHLVVGSTARRWGTTITGRFHSILPPNAPPADPTRDDQNDAVQEDHTP